MANLTVGMLTQIRQQHPKVYLPTEVFAEQHVPAKISVQYGMAEAIAQVGRHRQKNTVGITKPLWKSLGIPFAHSLHVSLQKDRLLIGPLVGILTTSLTESVSSGDVRTPLMRRFLLAQKNVKASYFVFSPQDMFPEENKIRGTFLEQTANGWRWKRYTVPFPAVVYDRIPNRKAEKTASAQAAKQRLQAAGVSLFNPGFFNKWTIHQHIHQRSEIHPYIPETYFHPTLFQLTSLLHKHDMIYLKPANGSLGLGIIQLFHVPHKGYYMRYRKGKRNRLKKFTSLESALQLSAQHLSRVPYIAQQGIRLLHIQGRPVDFRVHTNKNRNGTWEMTAIAAKIAGKGSVTTHMRMGGKVLSSHDVLQAGFGRQHKEVLSKVKKAVLTLSRGIEESFAGHFGEFGFDIGIDQFGHPWMFEANSKPGRHVFVHPSMRESEKRTRSMILDHALYLANFTTKDVSTVEDAKETNRL